MAIASPFVPRISIVIVTHNSLAVLPAMLSSISEGVETIIVDNASRDQSGLIALAAQHGAELVLSRENLGFGVACNMGAAHGRSEFLLFLNPDARLEPGALAALLACADANPDAVAFNPAISRGNGKPLFKRGSVLLPRSEWLSPGWPASDCTLPVLSGAAFFVRRAAFEAVGGFDPAIFLYHEDDDLALRLRAQCGRLMFVRAARVSHDAGNSTPRSPELAAFKAHHMGRSRIYATRKHGLPWGEPRAVFAGLAQILSPLGVLSARKRAKQTAFLRGVLSELRQGPA